MPSAMIVRVLVEELEPREKEALDRAMNVVNGLQAEFIVRAEVKTIQLPGKRNVVPGDATFDLLDRRAKSDRIFCVTGRLLPNEEFQNVSERCSLLTVADWDDYAPPSLQTYLIYQFAFAFLSWAANHFNSGILHHKKTRGCRMDYCRNKTDIRIGMLAGYICSECHRHLKELDVTPRQLVALDRILAYVQNAAKGQETVIDNWRSAFVVMRFSRENDENHAAYLHGIKKGLEDVGLDVQRADDRVEPLPLLEKITRQILSSRFIVAKVDDPSRMNVYYELGLAMGYRKDVLLVSERDMVGKLPSDLSNWECLTYKQGDYDALRSAVAKFYRDNYSLGNAAAHGAAS